VSPGLPSVSVVVCAYTEQRWGDIVRAVASVAAQHHRADELLLVVDHNEALAVRAARELAGVKVVRNAHARGLSGARNTGVELAAGEVIAFLDDDAAARPDWLERLLGPYRDPSVAAVGGAAFPLWPAGAGSGVRPGVLPARRGGGPGELDWVVGCSYAGQPGGLAEVRNLMGCNMSFRRDVFGVAGGFSEGIGRIGSVPLGCEETELCIRLRQRVPGARIVFEPAAAVMHRVGQARTGWRYLLRRCWAEGLSKAAIAQMVGRGDALSAERAYLTRVLPGAAARQVRTGALAGALAIMAAVLFTGSGYLWGLRRRPAGARDAGPIAMAELDLAGRPGKLRVGGEYRQAQVLLRHGRHTVGLARRPVRDGEVDLSGLAVPVLSPAANREREAGRRPLVSVVIPTVRPQGLARCVESVLGTGYPNLEVLAVDNGPGRADPGAVAALTGDRRVRYLHEPRKGVSWARNAGLAAARGEYVALVDDDVVVDRWWLHNLVAELADDRIDCATSLVLPARLDTPAQRAFEQLKGFGQGTRRQVFGPGSGRALALAPGRFGPASVSLWRRSALLRVGGFDPRLGAGSPACGGEDLHTMARLVRAGGGVVYTPHAVSWHEHRAEWADLRRQLRGYSCGLSAFALLYLAQDPGELLRVARAIPGQLRQLARPGRDGGAPRDAVPRQLLMEQLCGIACGPLALLRSTLLAMRTAGPR
jgi:O-antigen biosynthesis protein